MKRIWTHLLFLTIGLVPQVAGAQDLNPSATALLGGPATGVPLSGQHRVLASFILVVGATLAFLAIGKAHDFWSKRKEQAADLETRVNGALFEHVVFLRSSVAPTIHVPFWTGSPVTVTMRGEVPSSQLVQSALRLAEEAVSRVRSDYSIENRMTVTPSSSSRVISANGESHMTSRLVGALKALVSVVGVMAGVTLIKFAFVMEHLTLH
jgi:hypothetical protein